VLIATRQPTHVQATLAAKEHTFYYADHVHCHMHAPTYPMMAAVNSESTEGRLNAKLLSQNWPREWDILCQGQVPVFTSRRNMVVQLYPRELAFF
jgi:hypothetical protein